MFVHTIESILLVHLQGERVHPLEPNDGAGIKRLLGPPFPIVRPQHLHLGSFSCSDVVPDIPSLASTRRTVETDGQFRFGGSPG